MNASGFVDPNYNTLPEQNQDLRFVKQVQPQQLQQLAQLQQLEQLQQLQIQQPSLFHQYPRFGKKSVLMNCPHCQSRITTTVINGGSSSMAWVLGGVLCVLGFWLCACIVVRIHKSGGIHSTNGPM